MTINEIINKLTDNNKELSNIIFEIYKGLAPGRIDMMLNKKIIPKTYAKINNEIALHIEKKIYTQDEVKDSQESFIILTGIYGSMFSYAEVRFTSIQMYENEYYDKGLISFDNLEDTRIISLRFAQNLI